MEIKERNKSKEESKKSKSKVLKVTNESIFKSYSENFPMYLEWRAHQKQKQSRLTPEFKYLRRLQHLRQAAIAE